MQVKPDDGGLFDHSGFVAHLRDKQRAPHIAQIGRPSAERLDALRANRDAPSVPEGAAAGCTVPSVGMIFSPAAAASPSTATRQMTAV